MKSVAIIPARGGSKRIPRKNIRDFLGKPIISYSIEVALKSGLFEEVMVSTDDENIAQVAYEYGASVPFMRSSETSDDFATLNDVMNEVINSYNQSGKKFEVGCCILPTAPLITTASLIEAKKILIEKELDSIRPIVKFPCHIQRAVKIDDSNLITMINQNHYGSRSQDLEEAFYDAGQFYWFRSNQLLTGGRRGGLIISSKLAQDIDDLEDWSLAELKYKHFFDKQ